MLPYGVFIVAGALATIIGFWWRNKRKTAQEADLPVTEVADAVADAAIIEAEKMEPSSRWTRLLKLFRRLAVIALFALGVYGCTALTAATDAYKAVSGAQDTVVHVHRFDTVRVKIYEPDSTENWQ